MLACNQRPLNAQEQGNGRWDDPHCRWGHSLAGDCLRLKAVYCKTGTPQWTQARGQKQASERIVQAKGASTNDMPAGAARKTWAHPQEVLMNPMIP